jgi:hypothetical protein
MLDSVTWQKITKQKFKVLPQYWGLIAYIWTHHPDMDGLWPYVFLEQWSISLTLNYFNITSWSMPGTQLVFI